LQKAPKQKLISKRQDEPVNTPTSPPPNRRALTLANCDTNITIACLKALYQIPDATTASPNNSLGIFEQDNYYSQADLDMFYTTYAMTVPNGTYPIPASIDGGIASTVQAHADLESDIDLSIAISIIYPQSVTLYPTDDAAFGRQINATFNGLFNTFLDALDGVSIVTETGNFFDSLIDDSLI
jgi:tripeptidyl-peptidase I